MNKWRLKGSRNLPKVMELEWEVGAGIRPGGLAGLGLGRAGR